MCGVPGMRYAIFKSSLRRIHGFSEHESHSRWSSESGKRSSDTWALLIDSSNGDFHSGNDFFGIIFQKISAARWIIRKRTTAILESRSSRDKMTLVTSKEDRVPSRSRRHVREGSIIGMCRTVTRNNPSDRTLIKGRRERSEIADHLADCPGFPRALLISATRAARFYMNENHAAINHAINIINRVEIA